MSIKAIFTVLKHSAPLLLVVLLTGAAWLLVITGYNVGHQIAKSQGDAALAALNERHQAELAASLSAAFESAKNSAKETRENQRRANQLAAELIDTQQQYRHTTDQLKQEIRRVSRAHASQRNHLSLGAEHVEPEWVRLYNAALGYTGANSDAVQRSGHSRRTDENAAATEAAGGGVTMPQLIENHVDNSEQCRAQAAQLTQLITLLEKRR